MRLLLLCSATAKDRSEVLWLEENTLPAVVVGALCNSLFRISSLAWVAAMLIAGGMRSLSVHQHFCCSISILTTPTPHTTGMLLAVSLDMAKFLEVVPLRETILGLRDSQHYEISLYELCPRT
jgi:hypothetical protein